jgi:hypothetical protein
MARNPRNLLQKVVETAVDLCKAETAGISLSKADSQSEAIGTVWLVSHSFERTFDREDERLLRGLADSPRPAGNSGSPTDAPRR